MFGRFDLVTSFLGLLCHEHMMKSPFPSSGEPQRESNIGVWNKVSFTDNPTAVPIVIVLKAISHREIPRVNYIVEYLVLT
jgi:hypothetical protein